MERSRRPVRLGGALLACLVLAACGSGPTSAGPVSATATPAADVVPADRDFSGLIDIGGGRSLHLECSGAGSPTVVLISGTGNAGDVWREARSTADPTQPISANDGAVFPTTARSTRVCAYDRPGTQKADGSPGGSSAVAQPTSAGGDAADIHALLAAAGIPGPYVLVAHSFGGLIATAYARAYPDVVGLVLVDPASQFMEQTMGPDAWNQYVRAALSGSATDTETIDPVASNRDVRALPALPRIPVVVLSSDKRWFVLPFGRGGTPVDYSGALLESQALLARSLGATHVTKTNSAHDIYLENAPLVNQQICAVMHPASGC